MKFLIPFLLLLSGLANAGQVVATWTNPTSNTDGTALAPAQIQRTEIQYSTSSTFATPATPAIATANGSITTLTILDLAPGQWYFRARTTSTSGRTSVWSNSIGRVVPAPPSVPNPPILTTISATAMIFKPTRWGFVRLAEVKGVKLPLGEMCSPLPGLKGFGVVGDYIGRCG